MFLLCSKTADPTIPCHKPHYLNKLNHLKIIWCISYLMPDRSNAKAAHAFSHILYRLRNRVERFFNKLKQFRRIATRYEKLAANYLAMIKLATIRIWLRANESTP